MSRETSFKRRHLSKTWSEMNLEVKLYFKKSVLIFNKKSFAIALLLYYNAYKILFTVGNEFAISEMDGDGEAEKGRCFEPEPTDIPMGNFVFYTIIITVEPPYLLQMY